MLNVGFVHEAISKSLALAEKKCFHNVSQSCYLLQLLIVKTVLVYSAQLLSSLSTSRTLSSILNSLSMNIAYTWLPFYIRKLRIIGFNFGHLFQFPNLHLVVQIKSIGKGKQLSFFIFAYLALPSV